MAITLVLDAVRTRNLDFGRGFVVHRSSESSAELTPVEKERKEWQAVYTRTTVNSGSVSPLGRSPSGGSGMSIMRRGLQQGSFRARQSSSKRDVLASDDDFSRSVTNIIRAASQDGTSTSLQAQHANMHVMEYPPETGPCSWPYTEWSHLVELIREEFEASSPTQDHGSSSARDAVTVRQPEPKVSDTNAAKSSLIPLSPSSLVPSPPPPRPIASSSFHMIRLSDYLWMVAIVKCEEEGKWHLRRTRGHNDEEIRAFLDGMSFKLKVSSLFDKKSTVGAKKATRPSDPQHLLPGHDLARVWQEWDEANTEGFLRALKKSFQLRPQSPYVENLRHRGLGTPINSSFRKQKRSLSYGESAMAFFVGSDIQLRRPLP